MKHTCLWHDEAKTILVITGLPNSTWDDAYLAVDDQMTHIASVAHAVYSIYDLTHVSRIPKGVAFPNLQRLISKRQPNQALTIYVGMGYLLRQFMEFTRNIFGLDRIFLAYRFVQTMEEALQIIEADKRQVENA